MLIRKKCSSCSGTAFLAGEMVYCSGLGLVPEQTVVEVQLVQEITAEALPTSNFLTKIFNNLFEKSLIMEQTTDQL